jgi:methyl-accepting chemotaxis protein
MVIGDIYDSIELEKLQSVFDGITSNYLTPEPYEDEFGIFKSSFSPIRDSSGNVVAIVGADFDITEYREALLSDMVTYVLICFLIVALTVAVIALFNIIAYSKIREHLVNALTNIRIFSSDVKKSVGDFENGSNLLAESSGSSSLEIQSISSALEHTSEAIRMTGGHTQKATEYFSQASAEISESTNKMTDLTASIENIKNSSEEISQIIGIINDIAKQTKILALNAEVEAARVGDLGKGFAVVAREVGTLAQNSEDAAKHTNEIILKNNEFTKRAVSDTDEVRAILETVDKKIGNLSEIINEVSLASVEQSRGVDIILNSVASLKNTSSDNAQFAGEIKSSAGSLSDMTENLNRHVTSIQGVIGGKVAAV